MVKSLVDVFVHCLKLKVKKICVRIYWIRGYVFLMVCCFKKGFLVLAVKVSVLVSYSRFREILFVICIFQNIFEVMWKK